MVIFKEQLSEDLGPYSGTLLDIKVLNYDGTEIPLTPAGCIRIYLLDMSIHDKEHPFIVEVNEYCKIFLWFLFLLVTKYNLLFLLVPLVNKGIISFGIIFSDSQLILFVLVWAYFNKTKDDSNHSKDE